MNFSVLCWTIFTPHILLFTSKQSLQPNFSYQSLKLEKYELELLMESKTSVKVVLLLNRPNHGMLNLNSDMLLSAHIMDIVPDCKSVASTPLCKVISNVVCQPWSHPLKHMLTAGGHLPPLPLSDIFSHHALLSHRIDPQTTSTRYGCCCLVLFSPVLPIAHFIHRNTWVCYFGSNCKGWPDPDGVLSKLVSAVVNDHTKN